MKYIYKILILLGFSIILNILIYSCSKPVLNKNEYEINYQSYYKTQLDDGSWLFVKFDSLTLLQGYFFVVKDNALVFRFPFISYLKGKKNIIKYRDNKEINDVEVSFKTLNTQKIEFTYKLKGSKKKSLVLLAEESQIPIYPDNRYTEEMFSQITVSTEKYGQAKGYYASKPIKNVTESEYPKIIKEVGKEVTQKILMENLSLHLDIYQPKTDKVKKRPLLVLVHGGAFIIGDKATETMTNLAHYFAKRGYVVASVNYRLGYVFLPGAYHYQERCIYRATQDVRASIRYLVSKQKDLGIDTAQIFIAGNSAGGFLSLNTALMTDNNSYASIKTNPLLLQEDLGCLDCSTNLLKDKFSIKGIVNMWGALTHIKMLVDKPNIPILCFHGTSDNIVPPGHDYPFANVSREFSAFFTQKVFGSQIIHKYTQVTKTPCKLILFQGQGHDPHVNEKGEITAYMDTIKYEMNGFIYNLLKGKNLIINGEKEISSNLPLLEYSIPKSYSGLKYWFVQNGKIISYNTDSTRAKIVWFTGNASGNVNVTVKKDNGLIVTAKKQVVLK